MFEESPENDSKSFSSVDSIDQMKYSSEEQDQSKMMIRKLRQTKRKLLLKSVVMPVEPVDQLRGILLKLSMDSSDELSWSSTPANSFDLKEERGE